VRVHIGVLDNFFHFFIFIISIISGLIKKYISLILVKNQEEIYYFYYFIISSKIRKSCLTGLLKDSEEIDSLKKINFFLQVIL